MPHPYHIWSILQSTWIICDFLGLQKKERAFIILNSSIMEYILPCFQRTRKTKFCSYYAKSVLLIIAEIIILTTKLLQFQWSCIIVLMLWSHFLNQLQMDRWETNYWQFWIYIFQKNYTQVLSSLCSHGKGVSVSFSWERKLSSTRTTYSHDILLTFILFLKIFF